MHRHKGAHLGWAESHFSPLPLLFQVTPSSAVSVLQICLTVFCHCSAQSSPPLMCVLSPWFLARLTFLVISCFHAWEIVTVTEIDGCSAGLALRSPLTSQDLWDVFPEPHSDISWTPADTGKWDLTWIISLYQAAAGHCQATGSWTSPARPILNSEFWQSL